MRKPIIAGNWKMNMTPSETAKLIGELKPLIANEACDVVVCPPACCLAAAKDALCGSEIRLGAQNVHWEKSGAYTGEVSTAMLKELGVEYVIVGHSERRQYFGETDETVNRRARAALAADITPIICVGETLEQRESGSTNEIVSAQVNKALCGMSEADAERIVLAYEPIWAIGTGSHKRTGKRHNSPYPRRGAPHVRRGGGQNAHTVRRQHEAAERQGAYGHERNRRRPYRRCEPEGERFCRHSALR